MKMLCDMNAIYPLHIPLIVLSGSWVLSSGTLRHFQWGWKYTGSEQIRVLWTSGRWSDWPANWCISAFRKTCERLLYSRTCNFRFGDILNAWNCMYIVRFHFWRLCLSNYYRACKFGHRNTFKKIVLVDIYFFFPLSKVTVGEQKEEWQ